MAVITMRFRYALLILLALTVTAEAQQPRVSPAADIYGFAETYPFVGVKDTNPLTLRTSNFNAGNRNLALIVAGQSNCANVNPSLFTPGSSSVIDHMNVYDGASYSIAGKMVGSGDSSANPGGGPGNVSARLAQQFITNNIFDHVVVGNVCIGSTLAADWATGNVSTRLAAIFRRFASRGITPTTTSWSFAISWWQGESDKAAGTTALSYTNSMTTILASAVAAGFSCGNCRFFVNEQTWDSGAAGATIQGAQTSLWGTSQFFAGGNVDTLNASNRIADNTHFNDTGAAAAAVLVYNAMHASGAPF